MGEHRPHEGVMAEQPRSGRRKPGRIDQMQRAMIRQWKHALLAQDFTEDQAARLILAKFLYIRGSLRG